MYIYVYVHAYVYVHVYVYVYVCVYVYVYLCVSSCDIAHYHIAGRTNMVSYTLLLWRFAFQESVLHIVNILDAIQNGYSVFLFMHGAMIE